MRCTLYIFNNLFASRYNFSANGNLALVNNGKADKLTVVK